MVEYILIIAVIVSVILFVAKPFLRGLRTNIGDSFKAGVFGERANFYYFPLRRR